LTNPNDWKQLLKKEQEYPIIQYYTSNRSTLEEAYYYNNYSTFKEWFISVKNHENHQRLTKDNGYRSGYLLAIELAFIRFFNKIEENDKATYSQLDLELRLTKEASKDK